jgi:hypothetical protein
MPASLAALFTLCRLMLLIALPLEGLRGFGDFTHFFQLARLGRPFFDFWVEFPPVFPFFSRLLYLLSGGQEHVYDYLLALALTLCQAACVYLFAYLAERFYPAEAAGRRSWVFFALMLVLPYGWWYFDPLAVLALLLGLAWILEGRGWQAGIVIAAGVLTKWFPGLLLAAAWRWLPGRGAASLTMTGLGIPILVFGVLYLASPELTAASLRSQAAKGSWETVWALVDGNFNTGNFGPLSERADPQAASTPRGNPPKFPAYATLIPFALAGLFLFLRARPEDPRQATAFLGLACSIFFLWAPGWSPQWVLYLLPLILLALPEREGLLAAAALLLVNLLEWPVLLSRGYFQGLLATIPVRTLLIGLLAVLFYQEIPFCSSLVALKRSLR